MESQPALVKLKKFLEPQPTRVSEERCEFCASEISAAHGHVVNLESRALMCACRPCYLLFTQRGAAGGKYQAAPERYLRLTGFALTGAQWDRLQIPVGVAFFFFNSATHRLAGFYPSPAGATESLLPLELWGEWVRAEPLLAGMAADVEALLVRQLTRDETLEGYIVPIDACYELVGRIRLHWKGFAGGERAWSEIEQFFSALRARAQEAAVPSADAR